MQMVESGYWLKRFHSVGTTAEIGSGIHWDARLKNFTQVHQQSNDYNKWTINAHKLPQIPHIITLKLRGL